MKYTMIVMALLLGGCAEQAAYLRGEQPTAQQLQANREYYYHYMAQQRQQQPQPYFIPQSGSTTNCYGIGNSVSCRTSPDARVDTSMYRR